MNGTKKILLLESLRNGIEERSKNRSDIQERSCFNTIYRVSFLNLCSGEIIDHDLKFSAEDSLYRVKLISLVSLVRVTIDSNLHTILYR